MHAPRNSHRIRTLFVSSLLAVAAVAAANTQTLGFDITPGGAQEITDWSHGATVPKFDATYGTLTAVSFSIVWTATLADTITADPLAGLPSSADPHHYVDLYITDYDVFGAGSGNFLTPGGNADNIVDHAYGATSVNPGQTKSFSFSGGDTVGAAFDQAYMGMFNGASDPTVWFWANGYLLENASGSHTATTDTMVGMKGLVTYTFTPQAVPEPATVAALGLGALGLVRRRKVAGK